MVNYACGFNQSETGKYFEWIIIIFIESFDSTVSFFLQHIQFDCEATDVCNLKVPYEAFFFSFHRDHV